MFALFDTLENTKFHSPTDMPYPNDYTVAREFLFSYRGSEATFNVYRREIERFLHWTWRMKKCSIQEIKRADIENYLAFCQNPLQDWIGEKNVPRFIKKQGERVPNPEWRPFVNAEKNKKYFLSQKALQSIFAVLSSFYNYLIQEDYIAYNPVAQIRQKSKFIRKQQTHAVIRRLSELQWSYVIETAEQMAAQNPLEHERTLFIMTALFAMYLRISELAASKRWIPQMGHFEKDSEDNWWFTTVGKGNKERKISVSDEMLSALKRYRQSLGLSPLPMLGENIPLIAKSRGSGAITSTRQIRKIVQVCFDQAIFRMQQDNFKEEAEQLKAATVHWLRHTGISEDVKHRPREHVRDDAGHSSSAITDRYIDIELRERAHSAKKKKVHF